MKRASMIFPLVVLALFLQGCRDTVISEYRNRSEADAEKLFERGWLPHLIPGSATAIRVESDLDVNTASGSFYFAPSDSSSFTAQLHRMAPSELTSKLSREYLKRGYVAYACQDEDSAWTFFVNSERGYCEYLMSMKRP